MTIKITKPQDCIFGCCLPLEKHQFLHHYNEGGRRDFISSQFAAYTNYDGESMWTSVYEVFATTIKELLADVRKAGVTVIENFSLKDLAKISGFYVFTIVAHYNKDIAVIELSEGLYPAKEFVAALPEEFAGIYDLTACHAIFVRDEIKRRFSNQVISFRDALPIIQMMIIYKHVILNLKRAPMNYIDCLDKTITDLIK